MAVQQYLGSWKHEKVEGLDEFMKEMGVGTIKRTLAKSFSPTAVLEMDGDKVKVTRQTFMKTKVSLVEFGVERIEEDPLGGKDLKVTDTLEGDNWITDVSSGVKITRSIVDGKMVVVQTFKGVTCKRIFIKIK